MVKPKLTSLCITFQLNIFIDETDTLSSNHSTTLVHNFGPGKSQKNAATQAQNIIKKYFFKGLSSTDPFFIQFIKKPLIFISTK